MGVDPQPSAVPFIADPRFKIVAHVPEQPHAVLLVIHCSRRRPMESSAPFVDWAARQGVAVVAPHFPLGATGADDPDDFKMLAAGSLRFDRMCLAMVRQVVPGADALPLLVHGFSGGAQLAERLLLLNPHAVAAAAMAAPGRATLLDWDRTWWVGVRDIADVFGAPLDLAALGRVPVLVTVGEDDRDPLPTGDPAHSGWHPEANHAGSDRYARAARLSESLRTTGADVSFEVVPGDHCHAPHVMPTVNFFTEVLERGLSTIHHDPLTEQRSSS